jgi:hypothetical protein
MSEEVKVETETVTIRTDYSGNSELEKEEAKKKEVKSVITGKTVDTGKKKWHKRLAESITGDDARSVVGYVIFDVAVPALRDMAFDIVKEGAQRAFYGESAPRNSRSSTRSGAVRTNYGRAYAKAQGEPIRANSDRTISKRARSSHDFREIAYENRADVEMVMDELLEGIREYGEATVEDYYKLSQIEPSWADRGWGWTEVNDIGQPRRTRDGWMLELNAPRELLS